MFKQLCTHYQNKLDSKTFNSILGSITASYNQFFTNIEAYSANPAAYHAKFGNIGISRPPYAKKIVTISQASITFDRDKWRLLDKKEKGKVAEKATEKATKNGIRKVAKKKPQERRPFVRIKCAHKEAVLVPLNWHKFPVPEGQVIRSLNVNVSNDAVYLNFTYGHEIKGTNADISKSNPVKSIKKWAAGDVGMINVLSILVDDAKTPSLLICGNPFKDYNKQLNKYNAKLSKEIAAEATKFKTIKRKDDEIKIAIAHSPLGQSFNRTKTHIIECQNRYFDTEFDKLSRRVTEYLLQANVTDFVISKNLSFLKNSKEEVKLHSKTKQSFYHLPFGKLLNHIQRKCELVGITIHIIDEAYSSKVSCFSGDVRQAKTLRFKKGKSLSTTDCQGRRVKRGLYKDEGTGLKFHADINGAINHIKLANKDYDPSHLLHHKHKLCNPKRIKSDYAFSLLTSAARQSKQYPLVQNEIINQPNDQV